MGNIFVPGKIFYKDIKLDLQGNIFVLSGQPSKNKKQEIFILDQRGHLLESIELTQQTHIIHLDKKGRFDDTSAWYRALSHAYAKIGSHANNNKRYGFSVRCIKD